MKNSKPFSDLDEADRALESTPDERIAPPGEEEISLLDLAIVLVRYRRRVLRVFLITTAIGVVLAFVLPVRYTATTSILPPQQGGSAGTALLSQFGNLAPLASVAGGTGLSLKNPNDLQVALMKSRTVEDAMIARFHLMDLFRKKRMSEVRDKLEKVIDIESTVKDPLIHVAATDPDPQRAADLANGYVDEFKKFSATLAVSEASQRRMFFDNQLKQAKDNLGNAEEELKKTEQRTGLIQLDSQTRAAIEAAATLRAQVAAKEVQISALRSFATGENPELQIAEEELIGLQAQLSKIGAAPGGAAPALPHGAMQEEGLEYGRKLRDVRYYETIFNLLARQLEAAKVDEARQGAMVQVVDEAVKPDHHSSPKRTLIILGSMVLGAIIGVAWSFYSEGLQRISKNPVERARLQTIREEFASKKQSHTRTRAT